MSKSLSSFLLLGLTAVLCVSPELSRAQDPLFTETTQEETGVVEATEAPEATVAPETAETPEPAEVVSAPTASETGSGPPAQTQAYNPRLRVFHQTRPEWGVELAASLKAFGNRDLVQDASGTTARAFSFYVGYQPAFLQGLGIIGIGPTFGLYPLKGGDAIGTATALLAVGGQIQYQARFFREQPLVPMVGYAVEYLRYRFNPYTSTATGASKLGPEGSLTTKGLIVGAYLLLNIFEPSQAGDFYANHGVSRSYLVGELRGLTGSDENLDISGQSLYFGLRLEL